MCVGGVGTEGGIRAGGEVFCSMPYLASINHGSRHRPTAATRPHSRRRSIQQSAYMLGNRLTSLKLDEFIINNIYSLVQGTTHQQIIVPNVHRLRWTRRQCRASAATTTAHIHRICLPSRPACSVCHASHARGLGS